MDCVRLSIDVLEFVMWSTDPESACLENNSMKCLKASQKRPLLDVPAPTTVWSHSLDL